MKSNLVPQEIYLKHESEWQALRQAADSRIDLSKSKGQPTLPVAAKLAEDAVASSSSAKMHRL